MKKLLVTLLILSIVFVGVFAQDATATAGETSMTDPDPTVIGNDTGNQYLKEVSVDMFEREGSWHSHISPDNGVITSRLFVGGSAAKKPIEEAQAQEVKDENSLGVKVEFFRRGVNSFYIKATRPIPIEGVTKMLTFWVTGRNQPHRLSVIVQDYFGTTFELYVGTLDFTGWRQLKLAIPPSPDGVHGIVQSSAYYGEKPGLKVVGFKIDCDPMLARGTYYIYFDDLRAVTDLYAVMHHEEDDMDDNW